jgi:RHS repeat-associated protein
LILSKGKFDIYSNSDGLVSYPRISNWDIIVTKKNWLGNPIAYQYGSKYHPDQSLLIYDDLSYGMSIPIKLTAESGFLQMLVADVDGDGVDEIVKINSSVISSSTERLTFKVYSIVHSLGQGFASLKYQFTADFGGVCSWEGLNSPPPRNYIVGDFLGNGKQSVLCLSYNKNAKNETVSSWATLVDIDGKRKSTTHDKTCFSFDFQDYAYALDFDGDGKMDICHVGSGSTKIYSFNSSGQLVEVASTYGITRSSLSTRELLLGDINGDGKTDLVLSPRKDDYTYKTTEIPCGVCNGCRNGRGIIRPEEPYPLLRNLSELDSHSHNYANHVELNKDSIKISPFALKPIESFCSNPQIYREKVYNTSSTIWTTYYSTGKGFSSKTASICRNEGNIKFALQDMNGDNIPDLVTNGSGYIRMYLTNNGILSTSAESQYCSVNSDAHFITGSVEQYYKMSQLFSLYNHELVPITFTRNDSKQRLLTGVVNSLGAINKHLYANIQSGDSYYNGTKCAYPYMNLSGKFYVVKGLETYMNNSVVSAASLNYEKGILDLRGRGFLGFEKITIWDNLRGRSTTQVFDPYNFGVLKSEDSPLSNSTYTYSTSIASNRIAKVRMTYKSVKDKLKDVTTTYSYTHDTYGNITREIVDYGSGVSTTVNNVYYNYTGTSYRLGLLYNQSTTDVRNNKSLIRKLLISYDAKYQPINKRELYSENLASEETLVYDSFYNVIEKKSKPYSSSTWLSLKISYDQYGRQVRKTDALGLTEDYTYNTKGLLVSSKNHKGQLTTYEYNVWNQKIKEVRPDGSIQTITSSWSSSPANSLFLVTTTLTGKPTKQIYYDALGRGVREGELRFDGKYLYIDNVYDSRGRVQKTSLPFKGTSATHWNIFSYDTYDRVTQLAYASSKKDVYSYDKNSVTSVIDNISATKTYDTSGELISVSDPAGTIKFTLRPDRQIESTVSPGTVTTNFEYDVYGRQTAIVDPSAGRKTFAYDSYGNISQETNANGSSVKFTYDVYGRMTKKEIVGEQTVTYNFNTDGLLTSENSTNGTSKTYAYDANFQLTTEKETIVDGKWLQKTFAYSNNNLSSTVYSSNTGSIVTENYLYANGNLTEIKLNNATSIWKLTSENDLGMTTGVATGVLSQSYTFDQYGFPIERSVKNGSAFVQNFSYNFNVQTSNLNWRKDNTRNIQENFSYDNLNRLTHFSGNVISYDVKGNITDNTGVGKFSYNSSKPFAIETITPYGNSIPLRSQLVTYNALMRPTSITENGYIANYTYNGDGDRVKMHVKKNNTDELIRHYIGNQYEAESGVAGTKERLYLGGDAYTATAVYVKEGSGSWTVNFICRDYLGSITHVTNASGQLRQELSYDPWGRLRNPTNHAIFASGSEPSLILARGFTGHEHLTMFALINMNARLYDPILGRFLSPDPYIQNPFFSQNFNRYSYAWNNPLRFTDPDGEFIHIIVGAVVGGVINWVANGCQFNAKGLGYFGAGAASGALTAAFGPLGAMAGGAILGASNAALGGGDLGDILKGAGIGAVTGLVSGYAGQWASQYLGNVAINGFSVASPVLKGAIGGSLGGGVGGFAGGFTAEFISTGSFNKALDAGWNSAKVGFAMGGVMGAGAGAKWAHDNNKNMWTGKDLSSKSAQPTQVHHFASDKNKTYTPEMRAIAEKYNLDLDGSWNKQALPHQGRHPNAYHEWVIKQMRAIDAMPGMNQQQFIQQFNLKVIQPVNNNPTMLYKNFWNP